MFYAIDVFVQIPLKCFSCLLLKLYLFALDISKWNLMLFEESKALASWIEVPPCGCPLKDKFVYFIKYNLPFLYAVIIVKSKHVLDSWKYK